MTNDLLHHYQNCTLCPRNCQVDRFASEYGICGELASMRIASVGLHWGEEDILVGTGGSGTIFFTGCSLHCPTCQNKDISMARSPRGRAISIKGLANLCLDLQRQGAININLVTPTHFSPSIALAIELARDLGLSIPLVYNTSGYESIEALQLIDPLVDLYLLDIKTLDEDIAAHWCASRDYPDVIKTLIPWLVDRHPVTKIDHHGNLHGTMVRHLIYPETFAATKEFLKWYASSFAAHSWLSILTHFYDPTTRSRFCTISPKQFEELIILLQTLNITEGYVHGPDHQSRWIRSIR